VFHGTVGCYNNPQKQPGDVPICIFVKHDVSSESKNMDRIKLIIFLFVFSLLICACQKDDDIFNPDIQYGSITDIENNTYRTVKIGNQVWMAENLSATKYNDGSEIFHGEETSEWSGQVGCYCWYDSDAKAHKAGYGALYNWNAVNTGKLCPAGWHVPEIEEWDALESYLIANGFNYDGTTGENKIAKSLTSVKNWETSDEDGSPGNNPLLNNQCGFSALPAGFRDPTHGWDSFSGLGASCGWWSSSKYGNGFALHASLNTNYPSLHIDDPKQVITILWSYGFSVRCIKD
jgi:uncharacterized protein (TIGR02145 family)